MHIRFKQNKALKTMKGKLAYQQLLGHKPAFVNEADNALFKRSGALKFRNADDTDLALEGWGKPLNSIVFFLSTLYDAQYNSGKQQPEPFDRAYLTIRHKSEYNLPEIPSFVKSIIIPVAYFVEKMTGKFAKFKYTPEPPQ